MTEGVIGLLASWGAPALFLVTLASCLALPVPSSLMILTGGALAVSGDYSVLTIISAALSGAILGDQIGFGLSRLGQRHVGVTGATGRKAMLIRRARALIEKRGNIGVFLSRWLFSPLGPYANLAAGLMGMRWARFTLWAVLGEAVWVLLYTGLGMLFSYNIAYIADLSSDVIGIATGGALSLGLAWWLQRELRRVRHSKD